MSSETANGANTSLSADLPAGWTTRLKRLSPTLVLAWTVNDFATAEYLLELGVDGVATDNLAILEYYSEAPVE